ERFQPSVPISWCGHGSWRRLHNCCVRQISLALGKGNGELAARVHVAEKNVRQSLVAAAARKPCFDDRTYLINPGHKDGIAGFKHDYCVGVSSCHFSNERVLVAGK